MHRHIPHKARMNQRLGGVGAVVNKKAKYRKREKAKKKGEVSCV